MVTTPIILFLWMILSLSHALYTKHIGRCRLSSPPNSLPIPLEQLHPQIVTYFPMYSRPVPVPLKPLNFSEPFELFYLSSLGRGSNGEVFLVEEDGTSELKVIKRHHHTIHTPTSYQLQNYLMHRAGVSV